MSILSNEARVLHIHPHKTVSDNVISNITQFPNVFNVFLNDSIYINIVCNQLEDDIGEFNSIKIAPQIYQLLRQEDKNIVIWINAPYWEPVVSVLKRKLSNENRHVTVVYDILDFFTGFEDLAPKSSHLNKLHNRLLEYSDIITYTASTMIGKSIKEVDSRYLYLPNACSSQWDINYIGGSNKIGYFGTMAHWFNTQVINDLSTKFNIDLIGHTLKDTRSKLNYSNTMIDHGAKNHDQIRSIAINWQCGLIPFLNMELTQMTDPVKLYEYTMIGLPIVSASLPEIENIVQNIPNNIKPFLAKTNEQFVDQVKEAIKSNSIDKIKARKEWAYTQTWDKRIETFLNKYHEN